MSDGVEGVTVSAYRIPTDRPESDGTFEWTSTTCVVVRVDGGGERGTGYSYADLSTATLIRDTLADVVRGCDVLAPQEAWRAMVHAVRNLGRPGIASMAISAVDNSLWDLKARVLGVPLVELIGAVRHEIPAYGSGGFTSYTEEQLVEQLGGWAREGFERVKMKVGRDATADVERVRVAREAIGPHTQLFVDANGAYTRTQAASQAEAFAPFGVTWFEEPVSSDDLGGLHFLREHVPPGMAVAAGEYGYQPEYFERMLEADAVDVLQADATRCEGITGLLAVAALCEARGMKLSAHCAPALHAHPFCAIRPAAHVEAFHDHLRIERMLFDGACAPVKGALAPDLSRPGMGITLKNADAQRYEIT